MRLSDDLVIVGGQVQGHSHCWQWKMSWLKGCGERCRSELACLSGTDSVEDKALMGRYWTMSCATDCVHRAWMALVVDSQKASLSYVETRPSWLESSCSGEAIKVTSSSNCIGRRAQE